MEYRGTTLVAGNQYSLPTLPERFRPPAERRVPAFTTNGENTSSALYKPDGTGMFNVAINAGGSGQNAMALWTWIV